MRNGENVFTAVASSVGETLIDLDGGRAGFMVPEYQRTFDWNEKNLGRLMENCLSGFHQLANTKRGKRIPHTFLGTIILVKENHSELGFQGQSYSLIDGQQRITSLVLICCSLYESILSQQSNLSEVENLSVEFEAWIDNEIKTFKDRLFQCTTGILPSFDGTGTCFPRIVRWNDSRSKTHKEYQSSIAKFLDNFREFCHDSSIENFSPNNALPDNKESRRLLNNYKILGNLSKFLCGYEVARSFKGEFEYYSVNRSCFKEHKMLELYSCLPSEQNIRNRFINKVNESAEIEGLVRLLFFSSYLLKYVILTRVETIDEHSAFDLFDALNTTGEPLTAIETLKPLVVKFESAETKKQFRGTECSQHFERIEANLNDVFQNTSKRQTETERLLVTFALYLEGDKLSTQLAKQRNYLRSTFESCVDPTKKRKFVETIADIAEFRHNFWIAEGNRAKDLLNSDENNKWIRLCLNFLRDMNTSLSLPIIARYWLNYQKNKGEGVNEEQFVAVVKAITAFVVIWRGYTGQTDGIDDVFRKLMHTSGSPLCIGKEFNNQVWSIETLKERLKNELTALMGINQGDLATIRITWVNVAKDIPLYKYARNLCRFLLLAATDQSIPADLPGKLISPGVVSDELDLLNFKVWEDEKYNTVEHIAPQERNEEWDEDFYVNPNTVHTIGNLTLLPARQNSSLGNQSWLHKKNFYNVFAAKTRSERKIFKDKAKASGFEIGLTTIKLLDETPRLQILDSIVRVEHWTLELIEKRSENLLERAWDKIESWLMN